MMNVQVLTNLKTNIMRLRDLVVAVIPIDNEIGITNNSKVEEILAHRATTFEEVLNNKSFVVIYAITDYFQAQNEDDLPKNHWSFIIDMKRRVGNSN